MLKKTSNVVHILHDSSDDKDDEKEGGRDESITREIKDRSLQSASVSYIKKRRRLG